MEDFTIPNDRISASSIMQQDDKPHSARLNADWAWTARGVDELDTAAIQSEWLQVILLLFLYFGAQSKRWIKMIM